LGLVLIVEGLPYFAFPERMKLYIKRILEIPENHLRVVGLAAMAMGLFLTYISQK
jgi:uncharacterized protein YjeT (DUF2065 family)